MADSVEVSPSHSLGGGLPSWSIVTKPDRIFYVCGTSRLLTIFLGIAILIRLKQQQRRARKGDLRAARAVLLPVYEPLILILLVTVILEYLALCLGFIGDHGYQLATALAQFSLSQIARTGLVAFFCSHSLSQHSMQRSVCHAFVCCCFGFACGVINQLRDQPLDKAISLLLFHGLPLAFFIGVLAKVTYRRKSIVPFIKFMLVYNVVGCAYAVFAYLYYVETLYYISLIALGALEVPLSVFWYAIMWSDTYFWRTGGLKLRMRKFGVMKSLRRLLCWHKSAGGGTHKRVNVARVHVRPMLGEDSVGTGGGGVGAHDNLHSPLNSPVSSTLLYSGSITNGASTGGSLAPIHAVSYDYMSDSSCDSSDDDEDLDDDSWSNEYEREAMERIKLLQAQEEAFERITQERRERRALLAKAEMEQAQQAKGGGTNTLAVPSSGSGSSGNPPARQHGSQASNSSTERTRTPTPTSPRSPSPNVSPNGTAFTTGINGVVGGGGGGGSAPLVPSSRRRAQNATLLPPETLLSGSSDLLLSRDVQQLIEANKRRFIDFALLRMADDGGALIGQGGTSNVYAGFYRNYPVALKFFTHSGAGRGGGGVDEELTSESIAAYAKETSIAAAFNHPSIVKFIGICVRPPTIFLVMELCAAGSLFNVLPQLKYHPLFTFQAVLAFCVQASASIDYLHSGGYVHRDIKSLNYMVTKRGEIKLTDFGLSRMFPQYKNRPAASSSTTAAAASSAAAPGSSPSSTLRPPPLGSSPSVASPSRTPLGLGLGATPGVMPIPRPRPSRLQPLGSSPLTSGLHTREPAHDSSSRGVIVVPPSLLTRRVGSRCWMSPEMIHGEKYSLSSDVYSLTMVLWEILTCQAPFEEVPEEMLTEHLMGGALPPVPEWTPNEFRNLLTRGWSRDPGARPTAKQVHQDLQRMLAEHEKEFGLEPFDSSVFFQPAEDQLHMQHHDNGAQYDAEQHQQEMDRLHEEDEDEDQDQYRQQCASMHSQQHHQHLQPQEYSTGHEHLYASEDSFIVAHSLV